ncbi:MAG: hypothetical protein ACLP1X_20015 [Polyangiaceae bacterium]
MAATSGSLSPCAGSAGAYGDLVGVAGLDPAVARAGAVFAMGTGGIVPADVAAFTQWRSDSVLVPIVAATCTRLIPDATSTSACCFCAASNLRACGGTSTRAGAAALLLTFLVTFFLTMIASLPAPPDGRSTPLSSR